MNEQEMKQRFHEWLPWYVNRTLGAREREWMQQYLQTHPDARVELRGNELLRQTLQDSAPALSPDVGLDKFLQRIRRERGGDIGAGIRAHLEHLGAWLTGVGARPAFAAALALIVVMQTGVIGVLVAQRTDQSLPIEYAAVRGVGDNARARGPMLEIVFKPDASERAIRFALLAVGAKLIGGPGQLGNYVVQVSPDKVEQAAKTLAASDVVETVRILPAPPAP